MMPINDVAKRGPIMIDNAATASQCRALVDDAVVREAITLNIVAPLLVEISERDARIAALEAEASEGERLRGVLEQIRNMPAGGRDWCRQATNMRLLAQRALIPEAPAQPELASAAANQLSGSRVGEPAREGNPEDHPRYPALLVDAKARVRNENLDGSPRRHAVAREGE